MDPSDIKTKKEPGWKLLYDEVGDVTKLDAVQEVTMVLTLGHSDTVRIQASPGTTAAKGTQYFWLSKGVFDFFPALTEKNLRGIKNTYSCHINMNYIDLKKTVSSKVTFEADNNADFRLGTGELRYTKIADEGDIALITRISEYDYELRIIKKSDVRYPTLIRYATTYIVHQGKKFGFIGNSDLFSLL